MMDLVMGKFVRFDNWKLIPYLCFYSGEVCLTDQSGSAVLEPAILQSAISLAASHTAHITKALDSLSM
jgi:hypothetical protein